MIDLKNWKDDRIAELEAENQRLRVIIEKPVEPQPSLHESNTPSFYETVARLVVSEASKLLEGYKHGGAEKDIRLAYDMGVEVKDEQRQMLEQENAQLKEEVADLEREYAALSEAKTGELCRSWRERGHRIKELEAAIARMKGDAK